MDKPKLSVYVITYNQEDVIRRTMDSLLRQKDYIYEICINDDCSKDHTFEVLQEYQQQYPEIVKPVQNEHNLGIFENTEAVQSRLTGDMVYDLAGDDVCPDGYFKAVFDFIDEKKIDWKNELFCIHGDYMEIEPDGSSIVFTNKLVQKHNVLKLKLRKLISNRSACFSKKILDKFEKVSEGRSFNAESVQDSQLALFTENHYYIPILGNIYFAGIGISSRMSKEEHRENIFEGYNRMVNFVSSHGRPFDKKDIAFIEFLKAYSIGHKKRAFRYYFASIDLSLGLKGLGLDRIMFVLKKKIRKMLGMVNR